MLFLPAMASAQGVDLTPRSPGLSPAPRELLLTKEGSMPQAHGWNFHLGFPGVRLWGEAGLVVGKWEDAVPKGVCYTFGVP